MKKIKNILPLVPEGYVIISLIYYWTQTSLFNPIAFVLLVLFVTQAIVQHKKMGIVMATIFMFLNLYMFMALFSEIAGLTTNVLNETAYKMHLSGLLYLGLNLCMSLVLLFKNFGKQDPYEQKVNN